MYKNSYIGGCEPTYDGEQRECTASGCTEDDIGYYYATATLVKVTEAGKCEKVVTPGIYVTKDGKSYYAVNSDEETGTVPSDESCKAGGQFETTNGYFCLTEDKTLELGKDDKRYLFTDSTKLLDKSNDNTVVVKSDKDSITIDSAYMGKFLLYITNL